LTSVAGLLPVRQFDEKLGWTRRFADALVDERDADSVRHSWLSMVRQRVYGMLAGYEDQNDHDTLRHGRLKRRDVLFTTGVVLQIAVPMNPLAAVAAQPPHSTDL